MGVSNSWLLFVRENATKIDDFRGIPLWLRKPPNIGPLLPCRLVYLYHFTTSFSGVTSVVPWARPRHCSWPRPAESATNPWSARASPPGTRHDLKGSREHRKKQTMCVEKFTVDDFIRCYNVIFTSVYIVCVMRKSKQLIRIQHQVLRNYVSL